MAAHAAAMETLTERASLMRESMQKTQTITDNMVTILGSFDHRLSALETAMRPTQALFFLSLLRCTVCSMWILVREIKCMEILANLWKLGNWILFDFLAFLDFV